MLEWLISKVTGGLLSAFGNSILQPILTHLTAKADASRDIAVAQIGADQATNVALVSAEVEANKARVALMPQYVWIARLIMIGPAIHFAAICLSKTFDLGWPVAELPGSYAAIEGTILASPFVSSPLSMLARAKAHALVAGKA